MHKHRRCFDDAPRRSHSACHRTHRCPLVPAPARSRSLARRWHRTPRTLAAWLYGRRAPLAGRRAMPLRRAIWRSSARSYRRHCSRNAPDGACCRVSVFLRLSCAVFVPVLCAFKVVRCCVRAERRERRRCCSGKLVSSVN